MADKKQQPPKESPLPYKLLASFPNYLQMNSTDFVPSNPPATKGRIALQQWLGNIMRVEITDGRILVGLFVATDRDVNVMLKKCKYHYEKQEKDAQYLGTVLVAKKNIVSICVDQPSKNKAENAENKN